MGGKVEAQEILVKNFNACLISRHLDESERSVESDRVVTAIAESDQIPPWAASEVENTQRFDAVQLVEQRVDILRDIVVFGPLPETVRAGLVRFEGLARDVIVRGFLCF